MLHDPQWTMAVYETSDILHSTENLSTLYQHFKQ